MGAYDYKIWWALPAFQEVFSMLTSTAGLEGIDDCLNWIVLCGGIGPDIAFWGPFLIITNLHDGDRRFSRRLGLFTVAFYAGTALVLAAFDRSSSRSTAAILDAFLTTQIFSFYRGDNFLQKSLKS